VTYKDLFARQSDHYARYRPQYPPELYSYLASLAPDQERAWDCGTGSGQAAVALAEHFAEVIATDASAEQLSHAAPHPRVRYLQALAESSGIEQRSVSLVTVATAIHWFDRDRFYDEVRRVAKPGGVIAAWTYSLSYVSPEVDKIVIDFYESLRPFWPEPFKMVNDGYTSLRWPFAEIEHPPFTIVHRWTLDELLGFFRTWSPRRLYMETEGRDPVDLYEPAFRRAWGDPSHPRKVRWPLHLRVGRVVGSQ
jgi:SAM-dependent methyltransferase